MIISQLFGISPANWFG